MIDRMYVIVLTGSRRFRRELQTAVKSPSLAKVACWLLNRSLGENDRYTKRRKYHFETRPLDFRYDITDEIDASGHPLFHWPGARDPHRPALSADQVADMLAEIERTQL